MSYVIIGLDPGKMTGIFTLTVSDKLINHTARQYPASEVYPWLNLLMSNLNKAGWDGKDVHVSVEKFFITSRTTKLSRQYDAIEVTGIARALTASYGPEGAQLHERAKSNLAKIASNTELKRFGWVTDGKRHANDAARQVYATLLDIDYPLWDRLYRGETKTVHWD